MKTIEELRNFYHAELTRDLMALENERKKIAGKITMINLLFGTGIAVFLALTLVMGFFAVIFLAGDIVFWIITYKNSKKNYTSDFKNTVILRIIKFIDPNLEYYPHDRISEQEYLSSGIFRQQPDRYGGDDLVSGTVGQTGLKFSEIHSEYKTRTRNANGSATTQWHTIFKGIFFIGDFNKFFKSETFVLPDVAQKMFGQVLGNIFQSWNKFRGQLIKMEDPDFEKQFVVYGGDQIEARYILSTSLMRRITDFNNKTKKAVYLSFRQNNIYVAISYYKNLFEPKIYKTLLDENLIEEYFTDLSMAVNIVEDLNLNTRIWA